MSHGVSVSSKEGLLRRVSECSSISIFSIDSVLALVCAILLFNSHISLFFGLFGLLGHLGLLGLLESCVLVQDLWPRGDFGDLDSYCQLKETLALGLLGNLGDPDLDLSSFSSVVEIEWAIYCAKEKGDPCLLDKETETKDHGVVGAVF